MSTNLNQRGVSLLVSNIVRAIGLAFMIYSFRHEIRSEWVNFAQSKANPPNQISDHKINHNHHQEKTCRLSLVEADQ